MVVLLDNNKNFRPWAHFDPVKADTKGQKKDRKWSLLEVSAKNMQLEVMEKCFDESRKAGYTDSDGSEF